MTPRLTQNTPKHLHTKSLQNITKLTPPNPLPQTARVAPRPRGLQQYWVQPLPLLLLARDGAAALHTSVGHVRLHHVADGEGFARGAAPTAPAALTSAAPLGAVLLNALGHGDARHATAGGALLCARFAHHFFASDSLTFTTFRSPS